MALDIITDQALMYNAYILQLKQLYTGSDREVLEKIMTLFVRVGLMQTIRESMMHYMETFQSAYRGYWTTFQCYASVVPVTEPVG